MVKQHNKSISKIVSLILLGTLSVQVMAEDALELDDILVTAGLQPISIRDVASSVTVITREEIEQKQVKFLSELLRDVPGFAVSQAGGAGSQTQIRVRGSEANQLLVLMDGVRVNDPATGSEFQYQLALTDDIERIEIIRGPQSATWGSDAMAGVINIIRKKDIDSKYIGGNIEAGSFSTVNAGINGGYSGDRFQITGALSYLDTDGTNISRLGNEKDGADNLTGSLALDIDAGDAFKLRFSGQTVDASNDFDDIDYFLTGLPIDADRVTESTQDFLTAEVRYDRLDNPWTGSFAVNWMSSEHDNISDGLWSSSTASDTLEYRLRGGVLFGEEQNHRFGFGLEHQTVDFSQRGDASYQDPNQDQSYNIKGYAVEYVGKPSNAFTWTASARLDDYSDFDNATTWQLAGSYQLSPALRLRGSVGTGSKAPTFTERYGYYEGTFIGNPDLKPESSKAWEIGMNSNWSDGRYQFELTYFDQDLQDEIDGFVYVPAFGLFTAMNKQNDSSRKGLEAVFDTRLSQHFTLVTSYTYTDAKETDATGESFDEVRRPKHQANLTTNYYFLDNRGNLNLNLNYTGSQLDVFYDPISYVSELVEMDSYLVLNLATSWKLTDSLELTGRISNLLDEDYEEILGFVRPGRAVYAGIRGRFDF
jgi:vitamin B12 transporter